MRIPKVWVLGKRVGTRIGVVDMIVGDGGLEVPGFVATKNETLQLVRYWAGEILDLDIGFFLYGQWDRLNGAPANLPTGA